jgi:DNA-binding response OmpR family regulator
MADAKRILLVEDDLFIREMYQHIFAKEGVILEVAEDGQEGIDLAEAGQYDIILLDIMLPKKSGIEVLTALRKPEAKSLKTPIILLSNLGQASVIKEAFRIGADGYLLKTDLLPRQVYEKVSDFLAGKLTKEDMLASQSVD